MVQKTDRVELESGAVKFPLNLANSDFILIVGVMSYPEFRYEIG